MLSDYDFDSLAKPIIEMYNDLQIDLIVQIIERLLTYRDIGGSLEWQIKKLEELGALNKDVVRFISKYSKKSEQELLNALKQAGFIVTDMEDLTSLYNKGAFLINPTTVNLEGIYELIGQETRKQFSVIHSKAIESTKKEYINAINKAYIEVSSGVYSYNTAITQAINNIAERGITGATYIRNGKEVNYSLESVVRMQVVTALNKTANQTNEKLANELGANHYHISQHLGARNKGEGHRNHESWQGIVTQIIGSSEEYPNHYETTGEGKVDGLGGANCRHHRRAFFPGFSVLPEKLSKEDNAKVTELLEKQRLYERKIREYKRREAAANALGDEKEAKRVVKKKREYQNKLDTLIKENGDILKRQSSREQIAMSKFNDNSRELGSTDRKYDGVPEAFNYSTLKEENLQKAYTEIDKAYQDNGYENLLITDYKSGESLASLAKGDKNSVGFSEEMWDIIDSSKDNSITVIHNHPNGTSFSAQDIAMLNNYPAIKELIVTNEYKERYFISLGKNGKISMSSSDIKELETYFSNSWKKIKSKIDSSISDAYHLAIKQLCEKVGWDYGRKKDK